MAKDEQRAELHRVIWYAATQLVHGGVLTPVQFGDAYEYLIGMYAANSGKKGGEFYTPQEVSELLTCIAMVGRKEVNKVYDPACGSGSLLLNFAKIFGKECVRMGFYGQEINLTTYNLCRMNMFLHNIGYNNFNIALGDTLKDPKHWDDEPFEAIVSNPPFAIPREGDRLPYPFADVPTSGRKVCADQRVKRRKPRAMKYINVTDNSERTAFGTITNDTPK